MSLQKRIARLRAVPGRYAYLLAAMCAVPVAIMVHELGHYVAAETLGFTPSRLTYDSVSMGAPPPGAPGWVRAMPQGMGQAAGLGLMVLATACLAAMRRPRSGEPPTAPFAAACALIFLEAFRSLPALPYHAVRSLVSDRPFIGGFDELSLFAVVFGGAPTTALALDVVGVVVPGAALLYAMRKIPDAALRRHVLVWLSVGLLAGLVGWLLFVGPLVLP